MNVSMTVNGESLRSRSDFDVENPYIGQVFAVAPDCNRQVLDAAMEGALDAFKSWKLDINHRKNLMIKGAEAIRSAKRELVETLVQEQGKPYEEAESEITSAADWLELTTRISLEEERVETGIVGNDVVVRRLPIGVIAAITPWNYPINLALFKIAPALLAGNTMVLKPSPYTPLTTLKLGEILNTILPPGVLNVVSGLDPLGAWMTEHSTPRKVSFTGSIETGKAVAASAAADLKRLTLELGGNDAAIILNDADIDAIVPKVFRGAFRNAGQTCAAIKRVYVDERIHDGFVERLSELADSVVVGDGQNINTVMGPINNRPQFERVSALLMNAIDQGARRATKRILNGPGYLMAPTVVSNVSDETAIVREEQFGPVLPILSFRDEEDALNRANGCMYGLGGSIWSSNTDRARELALHLETGSAWVNQHPVFSPFIPFGGHKWSGVGIENGKWGLEGFTEVQTVNVINH